MRRMPFVLFMFVFLFFFQTPAHADVVDLTNKAKAQAYEDYYPLIARYKGTSGVIFESYSVYWNATKLAQLEQELLKNKHGTELSLLGSVKVFPDYPAGESMLGQYFAQLQRYFALSSRQQKDLIAVQRRYVSNTEQSVRLFLHRHFFRTSLGRNCKKLHNYYRNEGLSQDTLMERFVQTNGYSAAMPRLC